MAGAPDDDRFHVLADAMPQLVWTADASGTVDYYNSRRSQYAGGAHVDAYDWQPLVHEEDLDNTLAAWTRAAAAGAVYEFEHRIQMADGSYRWHLSRAVPVVDDGGGGDGGRIVKWFGTATDIHERMVVDQQLVDIAHTLQQALLPGEVPTVAGWDIVAAYRPARLAAEVGGDWYDVIVGESRLTLVIGDVAGHGVAAAATMAAARHCVGVSIRCGDEPQVALERTNGYMADVLNAMVTCLVVTIDLGTGEAAAVSAGHPPPVVVDPSGGARYVDVQPAPPLAVLHRSRYEPAPFAVPAGASCFLFTDGLIERREQALDVGFARLRRRLEQGAARPVAQLQDEIVAEFAAEPEDDVALLTARRLGNSCSPP